MNSDTSFKISDATVKVGDKEYPTILVESEANGVTTKLYLSHDVPVMGMVKMEVSGYNEPVMELVDFGE